MSESASVSRKLRSTVKSTNVVTELRRHVLRGGFLSVSSKADWKVPTDKMLVFLSSTFTDTYLERSYLIENLLFDLRFAGQPHGM